MQELKKSLGRQIQKIRKRQKLTQEKLAELIGIEVPSMSNIETGKYAPSIETLQKLSEVLDAKPWEFYYFDEISPDEMKQELINALDENQKLLKIIYKFYKSIDV